MKSIAKKLQEASELAAIIGLRNTDVDFFFVSHGMRCKLTPIAFQRIFIQLKLTRSRLKSEPDWIGDGSEVRYSFVYRQCEFWCLVKTTVIEQWLLDQGHVESIESRPPNRAGLIQSLKRERRIPALIHREVIDA